jgi:hypothetical protein
MGKYTVGQKVQGLAGGTVSGIVTAIRADTPGASAGPGVLSVDHQPHTGTFAELEMQRVSEHGNTKYGLTQDEQRDMSTIYRLTQNVKIKLREAPDFTSPETGMELLYDDSFTVDKVQVVLDEDGETQTFLRLATGGWAFEFHPTKGTRLCEVITENQLTAEAQEQTVRIYSEVKTALKENIASTETRIQAADATGNYQATVPLKKHLNRLNDLSGSVDLLKPKPTSLASLFGSDHGTLAEHQDRLTKLDDIRLSIPVAPVASLPDYGQEVDMGNLFTNRSVATHSLATAQKYTVYKLVTGRAANAAHGIADYMGIDGKQEATLLLRGVDAIREEFRSNGTEEQLAIVEYILDQPAKEEEESGNDGHNTVLRDKGHAGMHLRDFMAYGNAVTAKLEEAHVAALRIYTSKAFKCINDPLRSGQKPHPFAATTLFLSIGLKKLRSVNATATKIQKEVHFWRGMRNLELTEEFKTRGGTELGCMSTSTSLDIVAGYANSDQPLVFRLVSDSFMSCGIDISWLSVYPNEEEVLYPPLTFLQYLGQRPIKNSRGIVVDVKPSFS